MLIQNVLTAKEINVLNELWFCHLATDIKYFIKFDILAIKELEKWRQIDNKTSEGCGILIGEYREFGIYIKYVTPPQENDQRTRVRFFRRDKTHQDILNKLHQEHSGYVNYAGEWHSHPEANPTPSSIDLNAWKQLKSFTEDYPKLFLILGSKSIDWLGVIYKNELYKCQIMI